ncbi:hypothetical protein OAL00_00625 [Verrucomicrobiales bacterium]|nr:hypothetical protein [Verrucomicrobiales bacterium]
MSSLPSTIDEAHDLILQRINETREPIILGFLPLTEAEQDAILNLVRDELSKGYHTSIHRLLRTRAGAAAYAMMLARSKSELSGDQFWPCVEEQLGIQISPQDQRTVTFEFQQACRRLGALEGTVEGVAWVNAALYIFQAGILRCWSSALADGLRITLNTIPAPDIDDERTVRRFVTELGRHIHNQRILSKTLESDIGSLLVQRLVVAYLREDDSALPPHLRQPLRESFRAAGKGAVLRGPYLSFDQALDQIELVLPAQSTRITTPDSYWSLQSYRYVARSENRIPINELKGAELEISLCDLSGNFENQEFQIDARVDDQISFRIFNGATLRERRLDAGKSSVLPAGNYLVVMTTGADAGDDDEEVEEHGCLRIYRRLDLRPGDEPLVLTNGEGKWEISCALQPGVFVDKNRSHIIQLEGGETLHYGDAVGLNAYFPATDEIDPKFYLDVSCQDRGLPRSFDVSVSDESNHVFVFTENLRKPLLKFLSDLPPGIHRIEIVLSHKDRRIEHSFWYWRGLERITESAGFFCQKFPENVDLTRSKGIERRATSNIAFRNEYHAPFIKIALSNYDFDLNFRRAGVQVTMITPEEDWEEEPDKSEPIVVSKNDTRVLRFQSGGFQTWEILCGERQVSTLDSNRTSFTISLAGLCQNYGGSGIISAKREDGERIHLLTFSMPLTSSAPQLKQHHGINEEEWIFEIPVEDLYEIALRVTDYSEQPDLKPEAEIVLISAQDNFQDTDQEIRPGFTVAAGKAETKSAFHESFDEAWEAAQAKDVKGAKTNSVRFSAKYNVESFNDQFLAIDFLRRDSASAPWVTLRCTERVGYSSLRFLMMGGNLPDKSSTWWHCLRSARRGDGRSSSDSELAAALKDLPPYDLDRALSSCRSLLAWKYPFSVWMKGASRLQNLSVYLGRHCFNACDDSASIWWGQGISEISAYAASVQAPVARQFVFGSQPDSLRIPTNAIALGRGREFQSPVGRSLNLSAEMRERGGLLPFAKEAFFTKQIYGDALCAFEKFGAVSSGQSSVFGKFKLKDFLSSLYEKAEDLYESSPRVKVESLLSPEHLLYSVQPLNRRSRAVASVDNTEGHHPLAKLAQRIEKTHQGLSTAMAPVSNRLGIQGQFMDPYEEDSFIYCWIPPTIESRWGVKIAEIIWALCAVSRLAANRVINPQQFENWLHAVLHTSEEQKVRDRICAVLSLAPELFAFYVALFDLAFAESNKD